MMLVHQDSEHTVTTSICHPLTLSCMPKLMLVVSVFPSLCLFLLTVVGMTYVPCMDMCVIVGTSICIYVT